MKAATQQRGSLRSQGVFAAVLLLGLLVDIGTARGGGASDNESAMFGGGGSSGGIGTVPATAGGNTGVGQPNTSGFLPGAFGVLEPTLRLVGTLPELEAVITRTFSPDGSAWYDLQPIGQTGRMSLEFHGNAVVELDRLAFAASGVVVDLNVSPNFAGGVAAVTTRGGRRAVQVLASGSLPLKLHRTVQSGLVDAGLTLVTKGPQAQRTSLRISGHPGLIRLEQGH